MRRRCVLVFSKLPRPGRVKTRLLGDLTAGETAELAAAFLADLDAALAGQPFAVHRVWALEPDDPPPLPPDWVQCEGGLGERMAQAFARAFQDYDQVAIVGSDLPDLEPAACSEAFAALDRGARVVLGPAYDGGYYLIALAAGRVPTELFERLSWGGPRVLAETRSRCARLGLPVALLPAAGDVDTPEDLAALAARLAHRPGRCPATRALLAAWRRMPEPEPAAVETVGVR